MAGHDTALPFGVYIHIVHIEHITLVFSCNIVCYRTWRSRSLFNFHSILSPSWTEKMIFDEDRPRLSQHWLQWRRTTENCSICIDQWQPARFFLVNLFFISSNTVVGSKKPANPQNAGENYFIIKQRCFFKQTWIKRVTLFLFFCYFSLTYKLSLGLITQMPQSCHIPDSL